jgi:signal transduction histidine kinase
MSAATPFKFDRFLRKTVLIPIVALWFPLHGLFDIEHDSSVLDVGLFTILLALTWIAIRTRKNSALNVEQLATDLRNRLVELNSSRDLVSQIDIETRREVGVWLHGQVQSFHLSLARRMRTVESKLAHELADELDVFTEETIRSFSHRLYPPALEISLDLALTDLLEGRASYEISKELSSVDYTLQNVRVLPFRVRYILYRIVEECVANAEKKPSTKHISVEVLLQGDFIEVNVTDDGGPVPSPLVNGLGMRLVEDYLKSLSGDFNLATVGPGARFTAQFELKKQGAT